jgi:hypothetical protein
MGLHSSIEGGEKLEDQALLWAVNALAAPPTPANFTDTIGSGEFRDEDAAVWHARWRTLYAFERFLAQTGMTWAALAFTNVHHARTNLSFAECSCLLDILEVDEVCQHLKRVKPLTLSREPFSVEQWARDHPDRPMEALALLL